MMMASGFVTLEANPSMIQANTSKQTRRCAHLLGA